MTELLFPASTIQRKLPANYAAGELDFCIGMFRYETYPIKLLSLDKCVITSAGVVFEKRTFNVNNYSLLDPQRYTHLFGPKYYIKKVLFKRKRKLPPASYLLAFDEWTDGHYHWFCDFLPRVFALRERLSSYTLLLPDTAYIRSVGLQSLELLELKPAGIKFISAGEMVDAAQLSIVSHTCLTGFIHDQLVGEIKSTLCLKLGSGRKPSRKIYISRAKARFRKVLNEEELIPVLHAAGYEILSFEDLTWHEQLGVMADTKSLISIHGAGLVNALFMPPGGKVLEFRRGEICHNQCYCHLSAAAGMDYYYLFGDPDSDKPIEGNGCNLTIDPQKLKITIAGMEEG